MHVFFDEERVKKWMAATADPLSIKNMMCVSDNVRGLYEKARFALQPISKDENRITARSYWLPHIKHKMKGLDEFASCDLNMGCSPFGCKLFECATEEKIVSGYEVEFRTENPDKHHLPSWDLLDMQWAMHRVAAWGGAAAYKDSRSRSSSHPNSNPNSNPEDGYGSDDSGETVRPVVIASIGMGATMGVGVRKKRSKRMEIEGDDHGLGDEHGLENEGEAVEDEQPLTSAS